MAAAIGHTGLGLPAVTEWVKAGLIPAMTRRIIIDIPFDGCVTMYVEALTDTRMFDIDLTQILRRAQVVTVKDAEKTE